MATIRIVTTAAAALCAAAWSMHAPAQAQGVPLNIIEIAKSEGKPAPVRTKKAAATKKVSSQKVDSSKRSKSLRVAGEAKKQRAARAEPTRRARQRPEAPPIASEPELAFAPRVEPDQALNPLAAPNLAPKLVATKPAPKLVASKPDEVFAQASEGHVMGGADSVSLIARLPWWRNDNTMQTIRYGSPQAQSQVLAAAEAWLANNDTSDDGFDGVAAGHGTIPGHGTTRVASADNARVGALPKGDSLMVADAAEFNELDAAALQESHEEEPPVDRSLLHTILALLGGALAAAASARFLFV